MIGLISAVIRVKTQERQLLVGWYTHGAQNKPHVVQGVKEMGGHADVAGGTFLGLNIRIVCHCPGLRWVKCGVVQPAELMVLVAFGTDFLYYVHEGSWTSAILERSWMAVFCYDGYEKEL